MDRCLLCSAALVGDLVTDEHIIPQAIGGILTTKRAICRKCNSSGGQSTEAALTKQFERVCVLCDVIRDRGEGKRVEFSDQATNIKYELRPGGDPVIAANPRFSVDEEGNKHLSVSGPTDEEVMRRLRALSKLDPAKLVVETRNETARETLSYSLFSHGYDNPKVLRCVAKMAATNALDLGVRLGPDSLVASYIRADPGVGSAVGHVPRDVVEVSDVKRPSLQHGILLAKGHGPGPLVSYVWLFDVCEYSVLLHPWMDGPAVTNLYIVDLVTGREIPKRYRWLVDPLEVMLWTQPIVPDIDRFEERINARIAASWIGQERRDHMWLNRASARATDVYARQVGRGRDEAIAAAQLELEYWLRRSGVDRLMSSIPSFADIVASK